MTQNQIRFIEAQETARANLAREAETERANKAKESENIRANDLSHQISLGELAERERSNLENERRQAEALEYEKYGSKGAGGVVRTIKAGLDDTARLAKKVFSGDLEQNPAKSTGLDQGQGLGTQNFVEDVNKVTFEDIKKWAKDNHYKLNLMDPASTDYVLKQILKERGKQ